MKAEVAGSVILTGGKSRRMGQKKENLRWKGETFLGHLTKEYAPLGKVYLSTAAGWNDRLPDPADAGVAVIPDKESGIGPLAGIEAALTAAAGDSLTGYLFVCACDLPLMRKEFARKLFREGLPAERAEALPAELLPDAIVPVTEDGRIHPLAALYRIDAGAVSEILQAQIAAGSRKVRSFLDAIRTVYVRMEGAGWERQLRNVNEPGDYQALITEEVPVIGFSGASGTGKTTLIRKLVPLLAERGIRTAYLKHTHHPLGLPVGKDSTLMAEAGAALSVVAGGGRTLLIEEGEPPLAELLARLKESGRADLILVEGYKEEEMARFLLADELVTCSWSPQERFPRDEAGKIAERIEIYFREKTQGTGLA